MRSLSSPCRALQRSARRPLARRASPSGKHSFELGAEVPLAPAVSTPPMAVEESGLAQAVLVYGDVASEAEALGIPRHALPPLPSPLTVAGVRAAVDRLQLIIASRLSSNL